MTGMVVTYSHRTRWSATNQLRTVFVLICCCCLILTIAYSYSRSSLLFSTPFSHRDSKLLHSGLPSGQNLWQLFNSNTTKDTTDILINLHKVKQLLLDHSNHGKLISIEGRYFQIAEVAEKTAHSPSELNVEEFQQKQFAADESTNNSITNIVSTTTSVKSSTTASRSSVATREKTSPTQTTNVRNVTWTPTAPAYIVDGMPQRCEGCLSKRRLITVQQGWICGQPRLGNKMSMIAAPYIAALHQNAEYVMIHNSSIECEWINWLRDIFPEMRKMPSISANITASWPNVGEAGFTNYSEIKIQGNMTSAGYRQTWRYVKSDRDLQAIRELFIIDDKYRNPAMGKVAEAAKYYNISKPVYVGVHMRVGDLSSERNLGYGYQIANASFYQAAMSRMLETVDDKSQTIFAIATDSPSIAEKMLEGFSKKFNLFWLRQTEYIDFAALTMCNHTIISGGTYGYWAATLAGGNTIYHDEFAKPNTSLAAQYCSSCFNRPAWFPL